MCLHLKIMKTTNFGHSNGHFLKVFSKKKTTTTKHRDSGTNILVGRAPSALEAPLALDNMSSSMVSWEMSMELWSYPPGN